MADGAGSGAADAAGLAGAAGPMAEAGVAGPLAAAPAAPAGPAQPIAEVDNAALTQRDMLAFLEAVRRQGGLVSHNLQGYDELITDGIERILTTLFDIEKRALNERAQTEQDRALKSFYSRFKFHSVQVGRPVCTTYLTGQFADLYPQRARLTGIPYSGPVTVGATVLVRAHFADGRTEEKTAEIPVFQIGSFPVMVKGVNCHTRHATRAALKALGEDPTDPGGYFIAKRGEYVVDLLENIRYNCAHIHVAMKPNEHVRAEFLSQPGGAFENSSMIRVRLMVSGQLTVEINSVKFEKVRIPFFIIYRLFGMTDDRAVAETIVFDAEAPGPVTKRILECLERAFHQVDPVFAPLQPELNRERLVQGVACQVAKYLTSPGAYVSDESAIAYLNEDLLGSPSRPGGLDRILLPHMGQTADARIRKLRFLGLLIHKLFLVHLRILPPTDRDSYRNKRVHGAGVSLAKAFKTQVNNSVVIPISRALKRELRNNPWEALTEKHLVEAFRGALTTGDLNRAMEQAITSGNRTIVVRRRAATNRVSSQALERKNQLNTLCALRSIVTQNSGNASKQTERADMMRRVHQSYTGVICPAHSADTGENVGMRKQLALTAGVCAAGEAYPLVRLLLADPTVTPLDRVDPAEMQRRSLSRVFVNGNWVGCCPAAHELAARYRALRRAGAGVDPHATIYHDPITDEVEFWLDVGRLWYPLLIVDNNLEAYDAALRARHAWARAHGGSLAGAPPRVQFAQNVRFTPRHVREIVAGRLALGDLVREGVAEYITPEEHENCLVAHSIVDLRAARHDVLARYTHCQVEQGILGLAALLAPFANHTQPARITLHTNQTRQAGGWYALNYPYRTDKNRFFQVYNEMPLVATYTSRLIPPFGMNAIIAYASYGGDNQEDSAIVCQASADRGLFGGAFFRFELAELEKGESFCNPDPLTTKNLKPNASYEKLVDGFVRLGAVVRFGDVIIGRVAKLARGRAGADERYQYTDRSVVYRLHEPAVVEGVFRPRGANDELFGLIKLRFERALRTGDKMSSRSGNKCISPDHDVLTQSRGWAPIAEITEADTVATLVDGRLAYARPSAVHEYDYDGPMCSVQSAATSLLVTPNHRMYAKPPGAAEFGFHLAETLIGVPAQYARAAENPSAPRLFSGSMGKTGRLLRLMGFLAMGPAFSRAKEGKDVIVVPRSTPEFAEKLAGALQGLGLVSVIAPMGGALLANLSHLAAHLAPLAREAEGGRRLPECVWSLGQMQAAHLLQAATEASEATASAPIESRQLADDLQRLALHAGAAAVIVPAAGGAGGFFVRVLTGEALEDEAPAELVHYTGKVHCLTVPSGIFMVRRHGKPAWTGNSIVATMMQQSDMPFTEDGQSPDMIINTCSIPSRMTVGQLIEGECGVICAQKGAIMDGTAFLPVDHLGIARDLKAQGYRYNCRWRMYNGFTGEYFDTAIFMGPTAQQRLQKFVLDDEQVVGGSGPTDATTGQPLGGKSVHGGLRLGEMEGWAMTGQGAMRNMQEKMSVDSDGRVAHVCRGCGTYAAYNEYRGLYRCRTCRELADIAAIDTTKSALLFHEELAAAGIGQLLGLRPRRFEEGPANTVDL